MNQKCLKLRHLWLAFFIHILFGCTQFSGTGYLTLTSETPAVKKKGSLELISPTWKIRADGWDEVEVKVTIKETPSEKPLPQQRVSLKSDHPSVRFYPSSAETDTTGSVRFKISASESGVALIKIDGSYEFSNELKLEFRDDNLIFISTEGSDLHNCTRNNPCQRIQRGLDLATPGSVITVMKGNYPAALFITKSGTKEKPIEVNSFDRQKVIVDGADSLPSTGWTEFSSGVYSLQLDFTVQQIGQVQVNGSFFPKAQYPAYSETYNRQSWIDMTTTAPNNMTVVSSNLGTLPSTDLVGAGINVRTVNWRVESSTIQSYNSGTGTLGLLNALGYTPTTGWGFYLDDKLWMLTWAGATQGWYYDTNSRQLYLRLPNGAHPGTQSIKISSRAAIPGVGLVTTVDGLSHFKIRGLCFENAAQNTFHMGSLKNFIFDQIQIRNSAGDGISLLTGPSSEFQVVNSYFENLKQDAIQFGGVRVVDSRIENNTIINNGTIGPPVNSFAAIGSNQNSENIVIKNNTIENAGYIGIRFGWKSTIEGNKIIKACQVLSDCGAIYTYEGAPGALSYGRTIPYVLDSFVLNNYVRETGMVGKELSDSIYYGTTHSSAAPYPQAGIYLDNESHTVTVNGNILVQNERGFFVHDSQNIEFKNNILFHNHQMQVFIQEDAMSVAGTIKNLKFDNNVMVGLNDNPLIKIQSAFPALQTQFFNELKNTQYAGYITSDLSSPDSTVVHFISTLMNKKYSLASWLTQNIETNSQLATEFNPWLVNQIGTTPNLVSQPDFNANINGWSVYSNNSTATVQHQINCPQTNSNCLKYFYNSSITGSQVQSPNLEIEKDSGYLLEFDYLLADDISFPLPPKAIVRLRSAPYTAVGLVADFQPQYNQWKRFQRYFIGTLSSGPNLARIDLQGSGTNVTSNFNLLFDNISLQKVSITKSDPEKDFIILSNIESQSKIIECTDLGPNCSEYSMLDGSIIRYPYELHPGTHTILYWAKSPYKKVDGP